ncbi:MAG TPA: hypothetical protein VIA19_13930 [Burkholderiales bacterium]|jgi:hypothetical protein
MKRAMRWHDFGSGREASRSQYVEFDKGSDKAMSQNRASPWIDIGYSSACAGVAAKIGAYFVARLANIDILAAPRFASSPILARNARVFHCVRDS